MSELNLMVTISDRNQIRRFLAFSKEYSVNIILVSMGRGTAEDDVLHSFGFEASEKAVLFALGSLILSIAAAGSVHEEFAQSRRGGIEFV